MNATQRNRTLPGLHAVIAILALALASGGCVYRMNIQQGNYLENRTIDQLQVGMTRSQVRYLLGTPMVPDAFDKDRWDYLYYMRRGRLEKPVQRHLTVYFENDKVARIDRHNRPTSAADADAAKDAKKKEEAQEPNSAS